LLRPDIADHDIAGGDADADVDVGKAPPEADQLGQLGAESGKLKLETSKNLVVLAGL
jgi:hypothetical protein